MSHSTRQVCVCVCVCACVRLCRFAFVNTNILRGVKIDGCGCVCVCVCLSAHKWVKVQEVHRKSWTQHNMVCVCVCEKECVEGGRDNEGKLKGNDEQ